MLLVKTGKGCNPIYPITYTLRDGQAESDRYYNEIAVFTDEVLAKAEETTIKPITEAFQAYLGHTGRGVRSFLECFIEILALGTLWRVYGRRALSLAEVPRWVLTGLANWREQGDYPKQWADFLRGILVPYFLSPNAGAKVLPSRPSLENVKKLLKWLAATGEYTQEAKQLNDWVNFLASVPPQKAVESIDSAVKFAAWFEIRSLEALGKYTLNVERFLARTKSSRQWREDIIMRGQRQVEYHLNMVGAEILSRAYRQDFLLRKRKVVLLPACMRLLPGEKCSGFNDDFGFRCACCESRCRVGQLTRMGEEHGFEVIITFHETTAFSAGMAAGETGIVGVACVTKLISGGWKAKALGFPAQCILLDYCGCKRHWHGKGLTTDISVNQLKRVLGIET